jgi:hypothetical protein
MDDGVAVMVAVGVVVAVPLRPITAVESDALLAIETVPASVPAAPGLYVTVRLASFPGARVTGTANPETLTPEPEKVIPEIVTLPVPVLVNCTVFFTSLPTETVPNATDAGERLSTEDIVVVVPVPIPLRATDMVGSRALLVIVIVPLSAPFEVGLKRTLMVVLWPPLKAIGRWGPEAVNSGPATAMPEMIRIPVPVLVNVTVFVLLWPTVKSPKLTELGDSPSVMVVLPIFPVPLPVTPTQPEVIKMAARAEIAEIPRKIDLRANRRERIDASTRVPPRIGARVISGPIVCWGRFLELLVVGTQLGQGVNPVRGDSLLLRSRIGQLFKYSALTQTTSKAVLNSSETRCRAYGITAVAWFESTLCTLFESTAVTT